MTRKGVWDLQEVRDKYLDGAWENYGSYYSWGSGTYGQLGASIVPSRSSPVQVPGKWNALGGHNFGGSGIKDDGTLWSWGFNTDGQLGLNTTNPAVYAATQIGTDTDWSICCKCKSKFQYVIKTDGTLYCMGNNQNGRLGISDATYRSSPTQLPGTWKTIGSGQAGAHGIKTDGTLWGWGLGYNGRGGYGNTDTISSPRQLPGTDWAQVMESELFSMATKTDGTLWMWGKNSYGQLGQNSKTEYSSPRQIPGTDWSYDDQNKISTQDEQLAAAIKTDGTLWMWGYNHTGALGQNSPMPAGSRSSPVQVPGTTWKSVDIGGTDPTVIATKTDGTIWAWGLANDGRLGLNNTTPNKSSPTQIGTDNKWNGKTHCGRGAMYSLQKSLTPSQL